MPQALNLDYSLIMPHNAKQINLKNSGTIIIADKIARANPQVPLSIIILEWEK